MKIPSNEKDLLAFAQETVESCSISIEQRKNQARVEKNYFLSGTADGTPARYNRIFGHIDRLSSYMYSPANVRFSIGFDRTFDPDVTIEADIAAKYLSKKFHKEAIDLTFAEAVPWSFVHGSCFLKLGYARDGLYANTVQNYNLGAMTESLNSLDSQEAFVHKTWMPLDTVLRLIRDHPNIEQIKAELEVAAQEKTVEESPSDYFHEVVLSGLQPIQTSPPGTMGTVRVFGPKTALISPTVTAKLVAFNELWVMDDDRDDWATLIYAEGSNTFIEGHRVHRNLFVPGQHPFVQVTANEQDGYLWGRSEITDLVQLQDWLNERLEDVKSIMERQAKPPRSFIGFSGVDEERVNSLNAAGGWLTDDAPTGKIQEHVPQLPAAAFTEIETIISFFDDVAGFQNILSGRGEPGVRAGSHAQALMRTAASRLRDRALLIERQCAETGDKCFSLLQEKDERPLKVEGKKPGGLKALFGGESGSGEFLLSQIPDDASVEVDSHSASPAFQDDAVELAEILEKARVIDAEDFLEMIGPLLSPAMFDTIHRRLKERGEAEAAFLQAHPDVALEQAKHRR